MHGQGRPRGRIAAMAAALVLIEAAPAADPVDRFGWLSGDWIDESDGRWS